MTRNELPTTDDFRSALTTLIGRASRDGIQSICVNSGELHRMLGGYPGVAHRMPSCCNVMRSAMRAGDRVVAAPPKGAGASLVIRYRIAR
jgi:5-methylcytosine-specific restriction protein A